MKLNRVLAAAALLTVGSVAAASATDMKDFSYRCTPGSVRACWSLQVYTTLNGSGGTDVTILVRNLQGGPLWGWTGDNTGGSLLSRIGIVVPTVSGASGLAVSGIAGAATVGNPAPQWFLSNPGGLGGLITLTAGTNSSGTNGIAGCSAPLGGFGPNYYQTCGGGWVQLTFTTSNAWSANNAEVAVLTRNFANDPSVGGIECDTDNNPTPRPACAAVTPEPVTMILLGSGLAGMGGFGLVRRRKGTDVVSD